MGVSHDRPKSVPLVPMIFMVPNWVVGLYSGRCTCGSQPRADENSWLDCRFLEEYSLELLGHFFNSSLMWSMAASICGFHASADVVTASNVVMRSSFMRSTSAEHFS